MATRKRKRPNVAAPGFQPKPKATATLTFTDGDYEDAVVICSLDGSVGLYTSLLSGLDETDWDKITEVYSRFGRECLLSWNVLDNDGEPIPPTARGMLEAPSSFARAVISAWIEARIGVPAPLAQPSPDGDT